MGPFCQKFSLKVLLSFYLIFCQSQLNVAYESVAYEKACDVLLLIAPWLYSPSSMSGHNQTWQDSRITCIDLTLQIVMTSLQLIYATNVYGFISTSISPKTATFGGMVDQHPLISRCWYDGTTTNRSVTNVYDVINSSINPIKTKLLKNGDQCALTLFCR